jgi:hypothetical protein
MVGQVPIGPSALPCVQSPTLSLPGRRFGSAMNTNQKGKAQTILALGGTLPDSQATPTWGAPTPGDQRHNFLERLEHQTVNEVLPMTTSPLLCSYTFYPFVGIEVAVKNYDGRTMVDI